MSGLNPSPEPRGVLSTPVVQVLFKKLASGQPLTHDEAVTLISSHEELRGRWLVARERSKHLERDNAALLDAVRHIAAVRKPDASGSVSAAGRPSARRKTSDEPE